MTNNGLTWDQVKPLLLKGYWASFRVWAPEAGYVCRIKNNKIQLNANHMKMWEGLSLTYNENYHPGWRIVIPNDGTTPDGLLWTEIEPVIKNGMFAKFEPWAPGYAIKFVDNKYKLRVLNGSWQEFMRSYNEEEYNYLPQWSLIPDPDANDNSNNSPQEVNKLLKKEIEKLKADLQKAQDANEVLNQRLVEYQNRIGNIKVSELYWQY